MIASLLLAVASLRPLAERTPIREAIGGGEKATFTFSIPAGIAARIEVQQDGVDVKVSLLPAGVSEAADFSDIANGVRGNEEIIAPISPAPTSWTITVEPAIPTAARGDYVVSLETWPEDERGRALDRAKRKLLEGRKARSAADKASVANAVVAFDAAAVDAASAADKALQAEGIYQAGLALDLLGDTPGSVERLRRALPIMEEAGLRDRQGRTLDRLGDLARKTGEIAAAEKLFADALVIVRDVRDLEAEADVLNNHGLLLSSTGRWDDAITMFEQAIPIAEQTGSLDVQSALHHNMGQAYSRLGDFSSSVSAYERSLALKRRMNSPRRIANTLNNMANVYFLMGDLDKALRTIREALDLWETSGDRLGKSSSLNLLGRMSHAAGDDARAVAAFDEALSMAESTHDRRNLANGLTGKAEIDIDRGEAARGLASLERALVIQRETIDRRGEARVLYLRALALQKLGRNDEAITSIRDGIGVVEALRDAIARDQLRSSYLATVRDYYDLEIALLLQNRSNASAAFGVSERARARTLLEGLAESAAKIRKGVDPVLLAREKMLQRELNARESYRAQLGSDSASRARAEAIGRDIAELITELHSTEAKIRTASPEYAALQMPEPITAEDVQRHLLDEDTTLIAYHLGSSVSRAWVIDRHSVAVRNLPSEAEIDALALDYYRQLSGDRTGLSLSKREALRKKLSASGRRLFDAVVAPVAASIRGKRLLIIADGALQYVPFAALPMRSGEPLITRYEIVYAPSASVIDALRRQQRTARANRVAVFADPVFTRDDPRLLGVPIAAAQANGVMRDDGRDFPRLRFSREEAQAIVDAASRLDKLEALDFRASKSTLLAADLGRYRVIHFATHGVLDTEHPELSGLVLSLFNAQGKRVDGFLRLHEIYNLDLNADLVVLSACKTALGKEIHGEGLIGLTRGFMYAGASRVVSSVWSVDDRASAILMSRFYTQMLGNKTAPSAALRKAQLSMLREPRWRDPHDWAAFALQGEWR